MRQAIHHTFLFLALIFVMGCQGAAEDSALSQNSIHRGITPFIPVDMGSQSGEGNDQTWKCTNVDLGNFPIPLPNLEIVEIRVDCHRSFRPKFDRLSRNMDTLEDVIDDMESSKSIKHRYQLWDHFENSCRLFLSDGEFGEEFEIFFSNQFSENGVGLVNLILIGDTFVFYALPHFEHCPGIDGGPPKK